MPARILLAALNGLFRCLASDVIVSEVFRTLGRDRVRRKYRLDPARISEIRTFLESRPVLVPITAAVHGVASHPEDDLILATAVSAQADYLVTGDRQLLALGESQGAQIVTPRHFATILGLPVSP
jgi:putative PIN family toxin of toxin-antitoxin system